MAAIVQVAATEGAVFVVTADGRLFGAAYATTYSGGVEAAEWTELDPSPATVPAARPAERAS